MEHIQPIRAYIVVRSDTRERVSHELPTDQAARDFIDTIRYAEGDDFEVVPIA
jgi:hypothetical protein